jgi:uncharacterized membrane protein (UPF0127 family)
MIRLAASLCTALLLITACGGGSGGGSDASSSSGAAQTVSDPIPFDEEGTLAFLQEGDTVQTIQIEIAETDSARQRGMMQREGFPDETSGMLFPFEAEEPRSFWMANTPVALDIFFVSADSQIVRIAKYTTPYSSESIASEAPAQYVVETPAGFADRHGLLEGDRVRWQRTD